MELTTSLRRALRPKRAHAPVEVFDLGWVDEFISNVRPYVFVREGDRLLIKRPNQAQKLNEQGVLSSSDAVEQARKQGMDEMSAKFREMGEEVYIEKE